MFIFLRIFIFERLFVVKRPRIDPSGFIFNYTQLRILVDISYESLIVWYIFRFSTVTFWSDLPRMLHVLQFRKKFRNVAKSFNVNLKLSPGSVVIVLVL